MLITMDDFLAFMFSAGLVRLGLVSNLVRGLGYDFYAPFVTALLAALRSKEPHAALLAFARSQADLRKLRVYQTLADGVGHALPHGVQSILDVEPVTLSLGGVSVTVAPIGLELGGVTHILALYCHGEPLPQRRVDMTVAILTEAFGAKAKAGTVFAVFDIARGAIRRAEREGLGADLMRLAAAEALSFAALAGQAASPTAAPSAVQTTRRKPVAPSMAIAGGGGAKLVVQPLYTEATVAFSDGHEEPLELPPDAALLAFKVHQRPVADGAADNATVAVLYAVQAPPGTALLDDVVVGLGREVAALSVSAAAAE